MNNELMQIKLSDALEALEQEREYAKRVAEQLDEALNRLNRLGDHLRRLTVYAEGDSEHSNPADPFPDPPEAKKPRKRK